MPPKGANAKKESGRAKKAENESKKQEQAAAEKEKKEADKWADKDVKGGKAKQEEKEEKRKAELARKAENARLLAEEEKAASASKPKAAPAKKKAAPAKDTKPAGPGAIAAGGGLGEPSEPKDQEPAPEVESYAATGIDNALDLLEVVTAKMDKASVGQQAAGIEKHPEHPGLRLQQYKDLLYKQFQKSPENPFNQVTIDYNATKEDKVDALKSKQAQIEQRLRENK
ncbi:hypothetical protein CVT25_008327 [Psilocybe cyanescens]|uniref:DUF1014-domain-containing protein n=1 Tax=Psilocybe cyanescens TaxID=93625 RepID=A0A409WV76_PSICY|nr:hypothetical protein CVT25_008327 [Psilocybe cyanescens]